MISMEKSRLSETGKKANVKIKGQNNGYPFSVLFVMNALYQN
jgi:hypothetical protein